MTSPDNPLGFWPVGVRQVHVLPPDDLIAHQTDGDDCICGPSYELVDTRDGDGWIVIHAALDGREARERA